eukprot:1610350-Prymnesium_polylepis.2
MAAAAARAARRRMRRRIRSPAPSCPSACTAARRTLRQPRARRTLATATPPAGAARRHALDAQTGTSPHCAALASPAPRVGSLARWASLALSLVARAQHVCGHPALRGAHAPARAGADG